LLRCNLGSDLEPDKYFLKILWLVCMNCILCQNLAPLFYADEKNGQHYYCCGTCDLRFVDPSGYQKFVHPLYQIITAHIPADAKGLDYGCGEGPVLTHLLSKQGYDVALYDPFFFDVKSNLEKQYDFIFCIEVIEHFYHPAQELKKLKEMLVPGGHLLFMTLMYNKDIDFNTWFYRKDPTHVCFYSDQTFQWIQERFGFKTYQKVGPRVAWFSL
jgi:SAM-dependent methyltransferase